MTGGAEVFALETERVLRKYGHETQYVTTGLPDDSAPDNVTLLQAPDYSSGSLMSRAANFPAAVYDWKKRKAVEQLIDKFKPDIFHAFALNVHLSPSVIDAAHSKGVPVVMTANDYKHICPNYKLYHHGRICTDCRGGRFYKAIQNRCCKDSVGLSIASSIEGYAHAALGIYKKVDHFTFSSRFMAEMTERFWQNKELQWSRLLNPFQSAAYSPVDEYQPYGLYFGRLVEEKGVDRIVEAASRLDGFKIKVVGDGPEEGNLKAKAAAAGLSNVEFLGPLWGDALNATLSRARFVVVPSLWHENFPYVINQSFALGRPVIGSRRGGIPELVSHGERGFLFEPNEPGDLARFMRELSTSEAEARRMGANAKEYSDTTFSEDVFYADLVAAYKWGADAHTRRRG